MKNIHQYIEYPGSMPTTESFCGDPVVSFLYSSVRENSGWFFKALTSARLTALLGALKFDVKPASPARMRRKLASALGVDFKECADAVGLLDTPRKVFERKIRYWECRPMDDNPDAVVSPSDARMLAGSFRQNSSLYLKDKFFHFNEMFGAGKNNWCEAFKDGDFTVLRLTPDKYHHNHMPVSGVLKDFYEIDGVFQSCHPAVVIAQATPHSKNRRTVSIIDTDVKGGSRVGLVAMIEVVALMIGDIRQCYSEFQYENPKEMVKGMFLQKGAAKSLFRPGSSTVVLIFQKKRIIFSDYILVNMRRSDLRSLYSLAWGGSWIETDVPVRATIATRCAQEVK